MLDMELHELLTLPEEELYALMNKVGHLSGEEQRKVMGYPPCTCEICTEHKLSRLKEDTDERGTNKT